mgnify:CR=1 FL=1
MKEPGHMEAILERHAKLLWWMTDQARFAFLAELREDYLYEDQLRRVEEEMGRCVIFTSDLSPSVSAAL